MSNEKLVPLHENGKKNDLSYSLAHASVAEAHECFKKACERLLNPIQWHELAGALSARFLLYDQNTCKADRNVKENDYLSIDIPGPGSSAGNGYDWVKVVAVEYIEHAKGSEEYCALKVHPCSNPLSVKDTTAHFFQEQASSTFMIKRSGQQVISSYHGRNEVPNNETKSLRDNIRNTIVATGAAMGLSEAQWAALIRSFIKGAQN